MTNICKLVTTVLLPVRKANILFYCGPDQVKKASPSHLIYVSKILTSQVGVLPVQVVGGFEPDRSTNRPLSGPLVKNLGCGFPVVASTTLGG